MKKFEYKIFIGTENLVPEYDEELLNSLGNQGWELVNTDVLKSMKMDGVFGGKRQIYWLKREITKD